MMKYNTLKLLLKSVVLAVPVIFMTSCKKSTTSSSTYMTGYMVIDMPAYVLAGQQLTLSVSGITDPTDSISYKWYTSGFGVDSAAGKTINITAPVTIGDYTIQVVASHKNYENSTMSKGTTVLNYNEGGSFSGLGKGNDSITDNRDNKVYYYSKIGNLYWFTQNLNWAGKGSPYLAADAISYAYGRLYTWNEATGGTSATGLGNGPQGICPDGWKVPTNEDWEDLAKTLNNGDSLSFDGTWTGLGSKVTVNATMNGTSMWKYSPSQQYSNLYQWDALPGGNAQSNNTRYRYLREYGFWWSAGQKDDSNAFYRYIYFDNADFPYSYTDKNSFSASVRCVRDAQK